MAREEFSNERAHRTSDGPVEMLERSTKSLRQSIDDLKEQLQPKSMHGAKIIAASTMFCGVGGGIVTAYAVPKATSSQIMAGAALGCLTGSLLGGVIVEVAENTEKAKQATAAKKQKDDSRS